MTAHETIDPFATLREDPASGGATLVLQRWLPGPAARVWRYLTDADLRAKWLASGVMVQEAGAPFTLTWRNDRLSAPDDPRPEGFAAEQSMDSRVTAIDPGRSLTFTWGKGTVTFDLLEKGDRTRLTITHTGLSPGDRTVVAAGWHSHADLLEAEVASTPRPSFWSKWQRLRADYGTRFDG